MSANIQSFQYSKPAPPPGAGFSLFQSDKPGKPVTGKLDKLEQLTQTNADKGFSKLSKRAKAKFTQYKWLKELTKLKSPLHKNYTFALRCSSIIVQDGEKFTARYCGNRFCLICNRIRTGKLINAYTKPLDELTDKHLVTLTRPNVPAEKLKEEIELLYRRWRVITRNAVKQKINLNGIRKLEITYNPSRNDFHPHFHVIIEGEYQANWLLQYWLDINQESKAKAQDVRKCYDYKELFKYVTKLTAKPTKKAKERFYVEATDTIFRAIQGARIFQAFGTIKKAEVSEEIETEKALLIDDQEGQNVYVWNEVDWYNTTTGECLTDFVPDEKLLRYINRIERPPRPPAYNLKTYRQTTLF